VPMRDLVGFSAVDMFVDRDGRVLVNEIAPRPTIPVTGRSMPALPASSNCISAPSPDCTAPAVRHSDR